MSKILIVYYSLTGNTKYIAESLKDSISTDILELKPKKELDPESGTKYMWGGAQATMKTKPRLLPFNINPLDYDLIIIGTPVWAWTFTPPIRSFISKFDLTKKKVALWTCSEGTGDKAMERFKKAMKDSEIISTIQFQTPKDKELETFKDRVESWGTELLAEVS